MSAPMETAYLALQEAVAAALLEAELIEAEAGLLVDPPAAFAPSGDETTLVRAACILKLETTSKRRPLGGPSPRYAVTRDHRVDVAAAGPTEATWKAQLIAAETVLAPLPDADPTLGGACERWWLVSNDPDDLPPNGGMRSITFSVRVRSGDPLGLTP